jgi:cytidine deaminase
MTDTQLSRRTVLAGLGAAAVGLAASKLPLRRDESVGGESVNDKLRSLLPNLSEKSRALLNRLLEDPGYSGMIDATHVADLMRNENLPVEGLMLALLPLAQSYSQAPISNFFVGVVAQGASGSLYTGANIEIPGQCLGFAVHAEQSALSNAYMHLDAVTALAVIGGAPCGHCRQFMEEMSPDGEILILTPGKPPAKLASILPSAFGPAALGRKDGAFPVKEADLALVNSSTDELTRAALVAARKSYAPYSKSPSGVALRSARGRIYRGSYIENVAFNPSLSPLQVALAGLIAAGETYSAISAVSLVEVGGAKISQRAVTETVLAAVAQALKLDVALARA